MSRSMKDLGPSAACEMLSLWLERKVTLDEDEFDELCDRLYELLEKARDDRFRLIDRRAEMILKEADTEWDEDTDVKDPPF